MHIKRLFLSVATILLCGSAVLPAAELPSIPLPAPRMEGGKPLMQVLKDRKSVREFDSRQLPPQLLSDLLWAANGVNRPATGHRTAPSAMNSQEIDIYVASEKGLFLYDAPGNVLKPVLKEDLRAKTSDQPFAKDAPLALVFVADLPRLAKARPEDREAYGTIDAGFVSQNVYLFCASEGLGTVVHELNKAPLAKAMNLRPEQKIIIAQSVGYPKQP